MKKIQILGIALLLSMVSGAANASIVRAYTDVDGSGVITFTDLGGNQLQIEFDNTSDGAVSSVITGLVFDITDDVSAVNVASFTSGATDLTAYFNIKLDTKSNIVKGNTMVDFEIKTTGISGGIYNAADPGSNTSNVFPDIATLILDITNPTVWALVDIENDFLRMQRTGVDGQGSLKIPGVPAVPVPAAVWLFGSGLIGLVGVARRRA